MIMIHGLTPLEFTGLAAALAGALAVFCTWWGARWERSNHDFGESTLVTDQLPELLVSFSERDSFLPAARPDRIPVPDVFEPDNELRQQVAEASVMADGLDGWREQALAEAWSA
jgi:hypothetical protein